jgi:hypothetical protein
VTDAHQIQAGLQQAAEAREEYDEVDRATETLRRADLALASFSRELADVDLPSVLGAPVDQLRRTFDVWFDNIFSDLAVRSRIQDAARRVDQARGQVQQALDALAQKGRELTAELAGRREALLLDEHGEGASRA